MKALLVGLLVAQAVATFQVRQSNLSLHARMQDVLQAGFLAVPSGQALASLKTMGPAIWGGLFFTLSIGGILTLVSITAARVLPYTGDKPQSQKYAPVFLWALVLILINLHGFDLYANLYFLLIPPAVYTLSRRRVKPGADWRKAAMNVLPVIILALLWSTQYDQYMFIDIRDRLLLSNPVGNRINQFYYDYTLFAAEAFKAPSQKMIKTSRIDFNAKGVRQQSIKKILTRHDWLPVKADRSADLVIRRDQSQLEMVHDGRVVLESSVNDLASQPGPILEQFSEKIDRHALFRQICFYGLLFGFPILLYIGLYALLRRLFGLLFDHGRAGFAASATCLLLGIIVWGYFQYGRTDAAAVQDVARALASNNWRTQVVALRQCREKGLDVKRMPAYEKLKDSVQVPVRCWLVDALAASAHPHAFSDLVSFLDDPSLNVQTRACDALSLRNDRRAIPKLLDRLKRSDEWYFQWYAYKAMKALGWRQNASD